MVSPPRVIVATTSTEIANALETQLRHKCRELGLLLQVGPQSGGQKTFDSSEHLFSELGGMNPADLLDTLVVLHAGVDLEACFESKISFMDSGWHVSRKNKPGVAMELVLRFPQAFPVFLSPLVPPCDTSAARDDWAEFHGWLDGWVEDVRKDSGRTAAAMLPSWEKIHFASTVDEFAGLEAILERFANGFRSIFDPTGLRTLLRNRFLGQVFGTLTREWDAGRGWENTKKVREQLNQRLAKLAVVLEEESDLTLLTGYAAYKFGYRSWMINTYSEFINEKLPDWGRASNLLLLRDIDLRLPDMPSPANPKLSTRFELRNIYSDAWAKRLANVGSYTVRALSQDANVVRASKLSPTKHDPAKCEIIAQLKAHKNGEGPTAPDDQIDKDEINKRALRSGQSCICGGKYKFVGLRKPFGSIYAATELLDEGSGQPTSLIGRLPLVENMKRQSIHGAPYMNLSIAADLIGQARRCRQAVEVRPHLVAALLAQEAYSLLLGMSTSTTLAALREVHLAEAAVESSSTGVAYSVSIKERCDDLTESVNNICPEGAGPNFLAKLWADLRLVYKDGEQFEASERANIESLVNAHWFTSSDSRHERPPRLRELVPHIKRLVLQPLNSFLYLLVFWLVWSLVLTVAYCNSQADWSFSATREGLLNFLDVYIHVIVAISRAEQISDGGLTGVGSSKFLYVLNRGTDLLCALTSVLAIGLVVSVIFRKSTRG